MTERRPHPTARGTRDVGEGDGVVATQDDRDGTAAGHLLHRLLETVQRCLDLAGGHEHVAGIDHAEVEETVDAERERRTSAVVLEVTGQPDRLRTEAAAGAVAGAAVERRANDDSR